MSPAHGSEAVITKSDLDEAEKAARAGDGLDEPSALYLIEQLRRLLWRERLRGVLVENPEQVEGFLERDEAATELELELDAKGVRFVKLRHYAGDGLWRYALHDAERVSKGKALDPPLMLSRLLFR